MKAAAALTCLLVLAACETTSAPGLTPEVRAAIDREIARHDWTPPQSIEVRDSFLVIDWEVPETLAIPKRKFAEERLLAIRELVLPDGYKNFRLNVNGPPPGTGLVRRYGSARIVEHGSLEWVTP